MTPCPTRAVLYCSDFQETLSTKCLLTDTHHQHRYITLHEAVKQQLENIRSRSMMEPKVRKVENVEPQITAARGRVWQDQKGYIGLTAMEDFYSSVKEVKFDGERMRALEESVKKIVQKNRELLPRPWEFSETITFNKSRKHKDLKVSEKASEVSLKGSSTCLSKCETAPWSNIIAVQNFNKG
ncbi:hypothetical protein AOLI_G00262150 [Acnodon oligacanthus]